MTEVKRILDYRSRGKVAFSRHRLCVRALGAAIAYREGAQKWYGSEAMVDVNPVVDFWLDVERQLETEFGMSADEGRAALDGYRRRMASVGALDAVYHWEPAGRCAYNPRWPF